MNTDTLAKLADRLDFYARGDEWQPVIDAAVEAIRALAAQAPPATPEPDELQTLRRWKSTQAPRLTALDGLLAESRIEAAKGREAIASLESERQANAMLTAEVERLAAQQAAQAPAGWAVERGSDGESIKLRDPSGQYFRFYNEDGRLDGFVWQYLNAMLPLAALPQPPQPQSAQTKGDAP